MGAGGRRVAHTRGRVTTEKPSPALTANKQRARVDINNIRLLTPQSPPSPIQV